MPLAEQKKNQAEALLLDESVFVVEDFELPAGLLFGALSLEELPFRESFT